MGCSCEKKKPCRENTPSVIEINGGECPILFHTVNIPASIGNVDTLPPKNGDYRNARVYYEANKVSYLYDSDGIPQILSGTGTNGVASVNGQAGDVIITADSLGAATTEALASEAAERERVDSDFSSSLSELESTVASNTDTIATKANAADVYTKNQTEDIIAEQVAELGVPSTYWGQTPNQGVVSGSITLEAGDGISWGENGQAIKTDKFGTIITLRSKTATVGENTEYGQVNINHQGVTLRHVVNDSVPEGLKIVNLADGTGSKDAINLSQIQSVGWVDIEDSGSAYNKAGSVVAVNISETGTFPANTWTTVFTLPEGYRPSVTIAGSVTVTNDTAQLVEAGIVNITAAGEVQIYAGSAVSKAYGSVTFLV